MGEQIKKILGLIVFYLSKVFHPQNVVVFQSFPEYADNPYVLYRQMLNDKRFDGWRFVWILSKPSGQLRSEMLKENSKVEISCSTLSNWYNLVRARYIFSSHLSYWYLRFPQPHKVINLWHGMPLKRIGKDSLSEKNDERKLNLTAISTSPFFTKCMASAFGIEEDHVLMVGQPRNDSLFWQTDVLEKLDIKKDDYKSIGIWMPTFRKSGVIQDTRDIEGELTYWNKQFLDQLNLFLNEQNSFLILKLHPSDFHQEDTWDDYSNIKVVTKNSFCHRDLYPLLGQSDFLITDYSSVFIDYDILSKPMAFVLEDVEEYVSGRGLYFDIRKMPLPGKIILNRNDMYDFIRNHKQYVTETGDRFNVYKDANNSSRLIDCIID